MKIFKYLILLIAVLIAIIYIFIKLGIKKDREIAKHNMDKIIYVMNKFENYFAKEKGFKVVSFETTYFNDLQYNYIINMNNEQLHYSIRIKYYSDGEKLKKKYLSKKHHKSLKKTDQIDGADNCYDVKVLDKKEVASVYCYNRNYEYYLHFYFSNSAEKTKYEKIILNLTYKNIENAISDYYKHESLETVSN